jgi:hypothetical protein
MLPNNKTIDRAIGQRLRAHRLAARSPKSNCACLSNDP